MDKIKSFEDIPVMWQPMNGYGKVMRKFKKIIADKYNIKTDDFWDLHKWSVEHITEFWTELWDFSGIIYSKKYDKVIDLSVPFETLPLWFEGAKLNLGENLLKYRDDRIAITIAGRDMESEKMTFAQLYEESRLYAAAFRKFGLKKGDVVACQMTNRREAIIAMIAVVSIGAIWTGLLPLLGTKGVLRRIIQVQPTIYLTIDGIPEKGKYINMLPKIKEISEGLPSLKKVIIVASNEDSRSVDISDIENSCFLDEFLLLGREKDGSVRPMQFEQVSVSHPVFISFTSGTTGLPKSLVHGNGFLLSEFRDIAMHLDGGEDSVWFNFSPVGWASWNVFTCVLFCGSSIVIFEEMPCLLSPTHFWNLVDHHRATHFYIPSSILQELQKREYFPTKEHTLESLKLIMGGGSVVKHRNFDFIYEKVKKDVVFSSYYASTEMMGACFLPDVTLPVHRGESSAASLGVSVEVIGDQGTPVMAEMGDIVITKPLPNLPLGLWKDKDNVSFREKYFSTYPGKFSLYDLGIINPITKGVTVCCRSDETLKQEQYRFGSSEIYNVVETFPEVLDSVCVSQYSETLDERAVLFLKMREGYSFSDELVARIREAVIQELTVYHVPRVILETKDVPYNINGKKLEIVVKKIINNRPYNAETIINSECLEYFRNIPELQGF